jgi:RimJ/RimL family protein N-acetyltransferase
LFEIKSITENDLEEVLGVYQQCEDFLALGSDPKASMILVLQDMEESRKENGDYCGIYASSGKMIGVSDYISSNFNGVANVAFISLLMIGSPWRNRGIGTQILRLMEDKIREIALVDEIQTAVQLNNPAEMRFWRRNSYCVFGDPVFRPDQTVVTYLRKELFLPD